ncbi:MAG: biotin synthase BioB [Planctomycetota bacterium]
MKNHPPIDSGEALELLAAEGADFYALMARAGSCRERIKGRKIHFCGIINAKSGRCSENCAFCSQSSHYKTGAPVFPLVSAEAMLERAREVGAMGARAFSIVTSGTTLRADQEIAEVCNVIRRLREEGRIMRCASLGTMTEEVLARLKEAGLTHYHHNLETARSFFPQICTTHEYDDDLRTIKAAKGLGISVCCGGIFGMGETAGQRVELAETLRELDVDSIPLNFLNPIPGTPLEGGRRITPQECLKAIAVYRLMMPQKDIYICGGREVGLRDLHSWIFMAGANGIMVGNYLTTAGRDIDSDRRMIEDQGFELLRYDG